MQSQSNLRQNIASSTTQVKLPLIIWLVFIGSIMAFTEGRFLGYRLTGYGWFLPFSAAVLIVLVRINRVKFPVLLWLPWIVVVVVYFLTSSYFPLQRSVQLLCPLLIGLVVSSYDYKEDHIERFLKIIRVLTILLIVIILLRLRVPFTGVLPPLTGLAGQAISAALLGVIYATTYSFEVKKELRWWWLVLSVPVIAVTRTAILVTGLTLPLSFGPLKLKKRIMILIVLCFVGLVLFYSPRIQQKSFKSGEGQMSDILSKDFKDNARYFMWQHFDEQIKRKPWFGYGAGAGERFVRQITNNQSGYPHNDWRLTLYDYGIFGTSVYAMCILLAMIHAYRKGKGSNGQRQLLFFAGAASFIPFMFFMYTDNIMVYVSFFGNLQFTLLGMAYGAQAAGAEPSRSGKLKVQW